MKKSLTLSIYTAIILCMNISFINAQNNAKMYAIVCGGTSISDIGSGVQMSIEMITEALEVVQNHTGMEVETKLLVGANFTKSKIQAAINSINPSSNDVIWFYSTSHGFNYKDAPSQFTFIAAHPTLTVMDSTEFNAYALSLEQEVYGKLLNKGARLTIAMAEACNNIVNLPAPNRYKKMKTLEATRIKELFLETEGSIISCSSELNTYSYTDLDRGGFYTNMFLIALNEVVTGNETATWEKVFKLTGNKTNSYALKNANAKQRPRSIVDTPMQLDNNKNNVSKKSNYKRSQVYEEEVKPTKKKKGPFGTKIDND